MIPAMIDPVPEGAFLAQVLIYGEDKGLLVFFLKRKMYLRDQAGRFPFDPCYEKRHPHPDENAECADASYEALGLYYNYKMPETGWSSEGAY